MITRILRRLRGQVGRDIGACSVGTPNCTSAIYLPAERLSGYDPSIFPMNDLAVTTGDGDDAVFDIIVPVIDSVLRRRWRALRCSEEDLEDIRASVIARILSRLRSQTGHDIVSLRDYVAVATYHAIDDFFRHAAPQRHMLKNRLRHILRCDKRLLAWDIGRFTVAGLAEWRGVNCFLDHLAWEALPLEVADSTKPVAAVYAAISSAGSPVALDALVSLLAEAWQITECGDPASPQGDSEGILIRNVDSPRQLANIWREIRVLPLSQRRALLLNLREEEGTNALASFVLTGVTTIEGLSSVVELDLAARWDSLPLSDNEIAAILALTRQQVINLRVAARRRLRRHLQLGVTLSVKETARASGEKCTSNEIG